MQNWIKAINPTAPITTEAEALRSARASTFAVAIGAVVGAISVVQMIVRKDEIAAAAAAAAASDPMAAGMVGTMTQVMLYFAVALVVIQVILAFVQWFKPNIIIPILFTVLIVGGLLLPLLPSPVEKPPIDVARVALTYGIAAIQLLLHTAGIRGASKLDKIRFAEANREDY